METIRDENIVNGNTTLAKFMGAVLHKNWTNEIYKEPADTFEFIIPATKYACKHWIPEELQYHKDWNWLMPVVEKIETIRSNGNDGLRIIRHQAIFNDGKTVNFLEDTKISAVWNACVTLAEKYNKEKTF